MGVEYLNEQGEIDYLPDTSHDWLDTTPGGAAHHTKRGVDDAEAWLAEHDPEYDASSWRWQDLAKDGYRRPWREIPFSDDYIATLIGEEGGSEEIENAGTLVDGAEELLCLGCGALFTPSTSGQRHCSETCRKRAERNRGQRAFSMCPACEHLFSPGDGRQRFCSKRCGNLDRQRRRRRHAK
jgi:hypothetical protein